MDAQHVLTASVLDIVFDGRNKDYGAYVLRKEYDRHLYLALTATGLLVALLLILCCSGGEAVAATEKPVIAAAVEISRIDRSEEQPKFEPPKPAAQPKIKTMKFVGPPVIVKEATKEEMPPENAAIEDARIGVITQEGIPDDAVAPPLGASDGVTGILKKPAPDDDTIFTRVEIESIYPGGPAAWIRFLNKTFQYPEDAQYNKIQGRVIVQFIVDVNGTVSDVEALSGADELKNEAIRVIRKSGTWTPAVQNGRKVRSYKKQPITFELAHEE